jgi:hypothetical protein
MRYVDRLAGQAGVQTNLKLTCQLDHSVGVGRSGWEEEFELLLRRWSKAKTGNFRRLNEPEKV